MSERWLQTGLPAINAGEKIFLSLCSFLLIALAGTGCSTAGYKAAADEDAFAILKSKQIQALGHTNAFSIETKYSDRDPDTILAPEIIQDRDRQEAMALTLPDALDLYFSNSPSYKNQKENLYLSALSLSTTRNNLGANLRVSPSASAGSTFTRGFQVNTVRNNRGQAIGTQVVGTETASVTGNAGVSLTQMLKDTGGSLSVSLVNSVNEFYFGNGPRTAISTLSATLTQPLLQGFGARNASVENLTQAERSMIYTVRSFAHNQNTLAVDLVQTYISLVQRQATVRNSWASLGRTTTNAIRARALGVDRMAAVNVDQAVNAELSSKSQYISAVDSYRASLDQFKITVGLPLGTEIRLDEKALSEINDLGLLPITFTEEEAYGIALRNRLDILNNIDQFEDARRAYKNEADRSKPRLDFTGTLTMANVGQTNYENFLDWDINRYRGTMGLQLVLPVDRLPLRNSYRQALIRFEQSIRTLGNTMDNLKSTLRTGIRTLKQQAQNYEIQKASLTNALRQVENTDILYRNGETDFINVNDAQQSLINAQNSVLDSLVTYTIARLRLLQNMGILKTDFDKFWLDAQLQGLAASAPATPAPASPGSTQLIDPDTLFQKQQ